MFQHSLKTSVILPAIFTMLAAAGTVFASNDPAPAAPITEAAGHGDTHAAPTTAPVSAFIYLSGVLPSFVPIDDLPKYWTMRVHDYNVALSAPTGWHWTALVGQGDYLNFVGITMLSGLTIVCYLVILPILFRKKDTA